MSQSLSRLINSLQENDFYTFFELLDSFPLTILVNYAVSILSYLCFISYKVSYIVIYEYCNVFQINYCKVLQTILYQKLNTVIYCFVSDNYDPYSVFMKKVMKNTTTIKKVLELSQAHSHYPLRFFKVLV